MDENNLNLENNNVTPEVLPKTQPEIQPEVQPEVQPGEVNNFSVTENNSWDKHQPSFGHTEELAKGQFSALQNPVPQQFGPQQGPNPNMQGGPTPVPGSYPPPPVAPQPPYPVPQPPYPAPQKPYAPAAPVDPNQEMTTKDWFFTLFLSYIPIAGLILMIVWAAEQNPMPKYRPRKTWATGNLIWVIIRYVLGVIFSYVFLFALAELFELLY